MRNQVPYDMQNQVPYDNGWTTAARCLCLIHPIDPRGSKVGGIETHVRLLLQHAPDNWRVLMVGVDGYGDCELGELTDLNIDGRRIEFLPVIHFPETDVRQAARSLQKSLTARFGVGLLQNLFRIQRAIGPEPASIELQRFELAAIPFLLRRPAIQIVHGRARSATRWIRLSRSTGSYTGRWRRLHCDWRTPSFA